jgi:GGDEF domain-containing protein
MPDGATPHRPRPRPVAGLPALDAEAVAKAWLLELLAQAPLADAAAVPVALLAAEAPALCAAIAAAVADDGALDRLQGRDPAALAARAGALAGAVAPADVVAAVEALRTVLHRALRTGEDAALAADTGDRLAHVCAHVAVVALGAGGREPDAAPVVPPDEPGAAPTARDLRPDGGHVDALRAALDAPGAAPVTVLAIELDDLERLTAIEGSGPLADALTPLEAALTAAAGAGTVLVREQPGRWWLVAERTGTEAGRTLAQRLVAALAADAPVRHGAALTASIGIAVFPDDGTELAALLEHADQGVFTARALGVPVA